MVNKVSRFWISLVLLVGLLLIAMLFIWLFVVVAAAALGGYLWLRWKNRRRRVKIIH